MNQIVVYLFIIIFLLILKYLVVLKLRNKEKFQNKDTHFKVIVTTYNPGSKYLEKCLRSIEKQNYSNYKLCVLDDASTKMKKDLEILIKFYCHKNKWKYKLRKTNIGPLGGRIEAINELKPNDEDVIISIDGDDELYDAYVFEKLNDYYKNNDILITFGTFLRSDQKKLMKSRMNCDKYNLDVISSKKLFRKTGWIYSHLKTFKYKLYKKINHDDLKMDNKYIKSSTDMALMYPMLEMSNKKFKCIPDILYIYNIFHPESNHNDPKKLQEQRTNAVFVRSKEPYKSIF